MVLSNLTAAQDESSYVFVTFVARLAQLSLVYPFLVYMCPTSSTLQKAKFDLGLIRISFSVCTIGLLLFAIAWQDWMFYPITIIDSFHSLANPTLRALLSNAVASQSQGSLFAGLMLIDQIVSLIFGVIFPGVWTSTINDMPNAFIFLIAGLMAIGTGCMFLTDSKHIVIMEEKLLADALVEEDDLFLDAEE